jgi:hypothetical protein
MGRSTKKVQIIFDIENDGGSVSSCPAKVSTQKVLHNINNSNKNNNSNNNKQQLPKAQRLSSKKLALSSGTKLTAPKEDMESVYSSTSGSSSRSYKRMLLGAGLLHIVIVAGHLFLSQSSEGESPLLSSLLAASGVVSLSYASEPIEGDDRVVDKEGDMVLDEKIKEELREPFNGGDAGISSDLFLALKQQEDNMYDETVKSS